MKIITNILHFFRKIYWFIVRPTTIGVKAIVIKNERVLLIKNSYEKLMYLAGGKVENGETPRDAVIRELKEEAGVITENPVLIGVYSNQKEYKKDLIFLFKVSDFELIKSESSEIDSSGFYDIKNLPKETSEVTRKRLVNIYTGVEFGEW